MTAKIAEIIIEVNRNLGKSARSQRSRQSGNGVAVGNHQETLNHKIPSKRSGKPENLKIQPCNSSTRGKITWFAFDLLSIYCMFRHKKHHLLNLIVQKNAFRLS